jgi:hypothetical protein
MAQPSPNVKLMDDAGECKKRSVFRGHRDDRRYEVTDHTRFAYDHVQRAAKTVVDTRNAIVLPAPHVVRLGAPPVRGRH